MDPIIKSIGQSDEDIVRFYDALAGDYDVMTDFEGRFVREKPFFHMFVEKYRIKTALDAGSGTGFHSLLLSQLGVQVTAVDLSAEMLEKLQQHAQRLKLPVKAVQTGFESLSRKVHWKFDALFCLGNSLPHLTSEDDLKRALSNFAQVLNPGGVLFVQILNYDRILKQREQIQSVKENNDTTFIRSYEYGEKNILFTLKTINRANGSITKSQRIRLRPVKQQELIVLLSRLGLSDIQSYGSISLQKFDAAQSNDLVVLARKR